MSVGWVFVVRGDLGQEPWVSVGHWGPSGPWEKVQQVNPVEWEGCAVWLEPRTVDGSMSEMVLVWLSVQWKPLQHHV